MKRILYSLAALLVFSVTVYAADDVASAVAGTVKKVDSETKTLVVQTDDGAEHTFHFTKDVAVHGAKDTAKTPEESLKGVEEGSRVAVHYTAKGSRETAHEVDVVGDGGLKVAKGTVTGIDRGSKCLAIRTADGADETFKLTGRAVDDSGKGIANGAEKSAHVTVYYTEDAGKKIAHIFE
jgi:VCBS repeat-containing protein